MELVAAKNYLLPRLDGVASYSWSGMGSPNLIESQRPAPRVRQRVPELVHGHYYQWHLGFEFNMPLGSARKWPTCATPQLALARERAKLQEKELEVSHQLTFAVRDMEANWCWRRPTTTAASAAQAEVECRDAAYDTGKITLDVLLQAQRTLASGRERLLSGAGELQQVDRAGPLPQGLAVGVQRRVPGRRAVAGQGLLRRPPPGAGPRRGPVHELRLHPAEGSQPRIVPAIQRRSGRSTDADASGKVVPANGPEAIPTPAPTAVKTSANLEPLRLPQPARDLPHGDAVSYTSSAAALRVAAQSRWADGGEQQPSGPGNASEMSALQLSSPLTGPTAAPSQAGVAGSQWTAVSAPSPQDAAA